MIAKIKICVMLDIPDEMMENINGISPMDLLRESMKSAHMEILDEDDNDFMDFGNQDVVNEVLDLMEKA